MTEKIEKGAPFTETLIGFFQHYDSVDQSDAIIDGFSFYPVFELNEKTGIFEMSYPNDRFAYGKINICYDFLDSFPADNLLYKVTFDASIKDIKNNRGTTIASIFLLSREISTDTINKNDIFSIPDPQYYKKLSAPYGFYSPYTVYEDDTANFTNVTDLTEVIPAESLEKMENDSKSRRFARIKHCINLRYNPIIISDKANDSAEPIYSNRIISASTKAERDFNIKDVKKCYSGDDILNKMCTYKIVQIPYYVTEDFVDGINDWTAEKFVDSEHTRTISVCTVDKNPPNGRKAGIDFIDGYYYFADKTKPAAEEINEPVTEEPESSASEEPVPQPEVPVIPEEPSEAEAVPEEVAEPAEEEKPDAGDFISSVTEYLRQRGRNVEEKDTVNYFTCITQGFITTFAGAPGTGKTTLCRLLAKSIGLDEKDGKGHSSYAEIPVERGWASIKDFVGYPDPFDNSKIIPSNADALEAFMPSDKKSREDKPFFMLLDEANLSPIEHYWSQFLRSCQLDDPEELENRYIYVAQNEPWQISPNLRFLATVNFDHTTEELSPRFLDRTWVITLKAPKPGDLMPDRRTAPPADTQSVSMEELNKYFGFPAEGELMPEEIKDIWDSICQAFYDSGLPLSPRNILAVEHYCIAACRWKEYITAHEALDFAVLQKILPTINGYGSKYESLMESLAEKAEALPHTSAKLAEMQKAAQENSGFYQFFIR